ncbi:olfactory receptor 6N1-like [Dendrobates tinctorius]|uniref:olfactory receptor 6N1-like n=1 Tax=Dendrobates tinctorius TaxID=92724 RepID=UPI003CC99C18
MAKTKELFKDTSAKIIELHKAGMERSANLDVYQILIFPDDNNKTVVKDFILLGFQVIGGVRILLFILFLVIYCLILCGNVLIITVVSTSKNLHTPMYFFILQLSISDILLATDIIPKTLQVLLNNGGTISFLDCITQCYLFGASDAAECLLLTVMAFDRYVAICNPLRYTSIMTSGLCVLLSIICWVFGSFLVLTYIITIPKLIFCGPNTIDYLFCDIVPITELACSDTYIVHLEIFLVGIPSIFVPTTIIIVSYIYIVITVLTIPSSTGRQKAFSTCSSHLIVVSIFYGSIFSVYIVPSKGQSSTISKVLSLLYTVFTPLVNPIIYSLRNEEIKRITQRLLSAVHISPRGEAQPIICWQGLVSSRE